jgi:hypothetical protein
VGEIGLQSFHPLLVVEGLGVELVIPLDLGGKPPVVEAEGFANHGIEAARPTRYKSDEPPGEGVHSVLSSEAGFRDQIREVRFIVVPSKGSRDLAGARNALDVAHDVAVAVVIVDAEVGGPSTILLVPHWTLTTLIGLFFELRDSFAEDGENLLVRDVPPGTFIQDSLGVVVDGVGSVIGAGSMGHGGLEGGISDLLHDGRADLLAVGSESGEEGSGGIELTLVDEVFQVTGRQRWRWRGNGECR